MSTVTSLMILYDHESWEEISDENDNFVGSIHFDKISEWMEQNGCGRLTVYDDIYFHSRVAIASSKRIILDEILDFLLTIEWSRPESLQVLVRDDHESKFTVYEPFGNAEDLTLLPIN